MPESPNDPFAEGPPGVSASGLTLSASSGLNSDDWCYYSMVWQVEHSVYYWTASDQVVNWSDGCDK